MKKNTAVSRDRQAKTNQIAQKPFRDLTAMGGLIT